MKNNLRITLAALLVLLAALYLHTNNQEEYYRENALPAVENILNDISDWQQSSMEKHLSIVAKVSIQQQQMTELLESYRPLGHFKKIQYLEFSKLMSAMNFFGDARISYQGVVEFESGPADITITLLEYENQFSIYNLNIKPSQVKP